MDEKQVENKDVASITQEVKQPVIQNQQENKVAAETKPVEENANEINWKKFREQREIERREKEASDKRAKEKEAEVAALKAAMDAILNKPSPQQTSYDHDEETEEQKIDKRVQLAIAQREAILEKQRIEREQQEFPQRLTSNYKDFNQVCTADNLDYLDYHYPEVAEAFKHMPDGYDKWSSVYKAVKRFVPNLDTRKDVKKAENNLNKPQSISSSGLAQSGNAKTEMRLDESRKADNWQRMQKILKGLN